MLDAPKKYFPEGLCGIVFDCDGVMIDSAAANRFLYNAILAVLGLPPISAAQEKEAFQDTFQHAVRKLVPENLHHKLEEAIASAIVYDRDILPKIKIMPGYRDFLEKAHRHGLKLAIDTNRTEPGIHKVLDFLRLPPYFDPIMCCTIVEPKPSPEGPKRICAQWRAKPRQCLFVGDSPDDARAARGAGLIFAGFGGLQGDISVSSWEELADLLKLNDNISEAKKAAEEETGEK